MGVGWGRGRSSCLGQPLSYYRVFFVCSYHKYKKTRDNKRKAGPDMSSSPPPIVAQIFVFFVFFWFSRWFCYAFGKDPLVFLVFSGFPKGFATLVCIVYIKHMVCMVLVYIIYAVHMMYNRQGVECTWCNTVCV